LPYLLTRFPRNSNTYFAEPNSNFAVKLLNLCDFWKTANIYPTNLVDLIKIYMDELIGIPKKDKEDNYEQTRIINCSIGSFGGNLSGTAESTS